MKFLTTPLSGVHIIEPDIYRDERGYFLEMWHYRKFSENGIVTDFVQDNYSHSVRHALRGLHYQLQPGQGKLIRVVNGSVYDVVIDIRKSSSSFGKWYGHSLSSENMAMLWCPPGFAHGFLVTSEFADVCYKCTDFYKPEDERTIRWDDPAVGIEWPLEDGTTPILSDKDRNAKSLEESNVFS